MMKLGHWTDLLILTKYFVNQNSLKIFGQFTRLYTNFNRLDWLDFTFLNFRGKHVSLPLIQHKYIFKAFCVVEEYNQSPVSFRVNQSDQTFSRVLARFKKCPKKFDLIWISVHFLILVSSWSLICPVNHSMPSCKPSPVTALLAQMCQGLSMILSRPRV